MKKILGLLSIMSIFALQSANADSITYSIDQTLNGTITAIANAVVTTNGTSVATVDVTSLGSGFMGLLYDALLNVNSSDFSVTAVDADNTNLNPQISSFLTVAGGGNFYSDNVIAIAHGSGAINFILMNNSGVWGSASSILTPDAFNQSIVGYTNGGVTASNFQAASVATPEPSTYLIMSSLLGVLILAKSKRKTA